MFRPVATETDRCKLGSSDAAAENEHSRDGLPEDDNRSLATQRPQRRPVATPFPWRDRQGRQEHRQSLSPWPLLGPLLQTERIKQCRLPKPPLPPPHSTRLVQGGERPSADGAPGPPCPALSADQRPPRDKAGTAPGRTSTLAEPSLTTVLLPDLPSEGGSQHSQAPAGVAWLPGPPCTTRSSRMLRILCLRSNTA